MIEGIMYNDSKMEYIDYDIEEDPDGHRTFDYNKDLLEAVAILLEGKWEDDKIGYAREDGVPDGKYAVVCFGDPYDGYRKDYVKIRVEG